MNSASVDATRGISMAQGQIHVDAQYHAPTPTPTTINQAATTLTLDPAKEPPPTTHVHAPQVASDNPDRRASQPSRLTPRAHAKESHAEQDHLEEEAEEDEEAVEDGEEDT
jgi:hypothetical protein